jgi:hypothetical protein
MLPLHVFMQAGRELFHGTETQNPPCGGFCVEQQLKQSGGIT